MSHKRKAQVKQMPQRDRQFSRQESEFQSALESNQLGEGTSANAWNRGGNRRRPLATHPRAREESNLIQDHRYWSRAHEKGHSLSRVAFDNGGGGIYPVGWSKACAARCSMRAGWPVLGAPKSHCAWFSWYVVINMVFLRVGAAGGQA